MLVVVLFLHSLIYVVLRVSGRWRYPTPDISEATMRHEMACASYEMAKGKSCGDASVRCRRDASAEGYGSDKR